MPHKRTEERAHRTPTRRGAEAEDAISLLRADHKLVEDLFREFEGLKEEDTSEMEQIVKQACMALQVHTQIEEEIFYPAASEVLEEDESLVLEARVEHEAAKQLIQKLEQGDSSDPQYHATFRVLCAYVRHHIEEEQRRLFPKLKRKGLDLEELGKRLQQRKSELMPQEEQQHHA